jgi:hypothetical protein
MTKMEMQQMLEFLLNEMRADKEDFQLKMEANKEEMKADRKTDKEDFMARMNERWTNRKSECDTTAKPRKCSG